MACQAQATFQLQNILIRMSDTSFVEFSCREHLADSVRRFLLLYEQEGVAVTLV